MTRCHLHRRGSAFALKVSGLISEASIMLLCVVLAVRLLTAGSLRKSKSLVLKYLVYKISLKSMEGKGRAIADSCATYRLCQTVDLWCCCTVTIVMHD